MTLINVYAYKVIMNPKDEVSEPVSPLHSEYHVTSLLEVAQDLVVQGGARGYPGCSFSPAVAGFTLLCLVPTFIAIFYCSTTTTTTRFI